MKQRPWLFAVDEPTNRRFWRGCLGKIKFPSKKNADGKIRSMDDPALRSYKCSLCGSWHIGHRGRRVTIVVVEEDSL